jgi:hypothetical protein
VASSLPEHVEPHLIIYHNGHAGVMGLVTSHGKFSSLGRYFLISTECMERSRYSSAPVDRDLCVRATKEKGTVTPESTSLKIDSSVRGTEL